jgi:hypothetical protein
MKAPCVFRDWGREHGLATINRSAWQCEDSRQSPCLSRERTAMTGSNGPLARLVPALETTPGSGQTPGRLGVRRAVPEQ